MPAKAKRPLVWDNCHEVLKQKALGNGWALCIGAGASRGPFPDWAALVKALLRADPRITDVDALFKELSSSFSLDALIQAGKEILELDESEFDERLQEFLYEKLHTDAGAAWPLVVKALTTSSPGQMNRREWEGFRDFIGRQYPSLSATQIAQSIVKVARTPLQPAAILSFNAEPLLYALIHTTVACATPAGTPLKDARLLDRVTRGISTREQGRIPYVFCHGLMPVKGGLKLFPKLASPDKLVFSEGEYLQLANSAFSWQSSLFLGTAVLRSMVFIGLSFSDPNLRRWLAWIHSNRVTELSFQGRESGAHSHFWLTSDPGDETKRAWIEASVRHLGVRVIWIDSWSRIGAYLDRMLGL